MSIIPAVFFLNYVGAWCLPVLNMLGLVLSNSMVLYLLRRDGFKYTHDWDSSIRLIGIMVLVSAIAFGVKYAFSLHWIIVICVVLALYPIFLMLIYRRKMVELINLMRSGNY